MCRLIFWCFIFIIFYSVRGFTDDPEECGLKQIPCYDDQCIDEEKWCDGTIDCADGSDELNCNRKETNKSSFNTDENITETLPTTFWNTQTSELVEELFTPIEEIPLGDSHFKLSNKQYINPMIKARNWLLTERNGYHWGDDTHRAITALHLTKNPFTVSDTKDELLMSKELHLQIILAITRNEFEISLGELALYINALQASCYNPRRFYRFDLVKILRQMVDVEHSAKRLVVPLVYLTLCLNNATTYSDSVKFDKLLSNKNPLIDRVDFQALSVLASDCMAKKDPRNGRHILHLSNSAQTKLLATLEKGLPENVYELALAVQALNEARVDTDERLREEAMKYILNQQNESGSFGDILATYYVLPILNGKSLLSLNDSCNQTYDCGDLVPSRVLRRTNEPEYIVVSYSLYHGDPVESSLSIQLRVVHGTTFFEIMKIAQETNPSFRFSLDNHSNFLSIYSIGAVPRDAEKGMYWELYTAPRNCTRTGTIPYNSSPSNESIKNLVPKDGDELIFWYKSMYEHIQ